VDAGFNDERGRLVWTLPQQAEQLLSKAQQDQQAKVIDFFNKAFGILAFALLTGFTNQRLTQHLEGVLNILGDLTTLAQAQAQQQDC
jgi:hypothetical protein